MNYLKPLWDRWMNHELYNKIGLARPFSWQSSHKTTGIGRAGTLSVYDWLKMTGVCWKVMKHSNELRNNNNVSLCDGDETDVNRGMFLSSKV